MALSDMASDHARVITPESWGPSIDLFVGDGSCREMVGPRIGAQLRSLYSIELSAGSATIPLRHDAESAYYIAAGDITVESTASSSKTLGEGGMFHILPYTDYRIVASSAARLIGGPSPVDPNFGQHAQQLAVPDSYFTRGDPIRTFHRDKPGLMVPMISRDARLIIWYGCGAVTANINYVVLEPGERNADHVHPTSEDTVHILEGRGTVTDVTHGLSLPFGPGDSVHIPPGLVHAIAADRGERVVSTGGPCPADLEMLRHAGVDVDALNTTALHGAST